MAKILTATTAILYGNQQYGPGDALPTADPDYVSAWLEAGSAEWKDDAEEPAPKKQAPKARLAAAPAGATGIAQPATGAEEDLVGKVPAPKARGVVKERAKRAPKSKA